MSELHESRLAVLEQVVRSTEQALQDIRADLRGLRSDIDRRFGDIDRRFGDVERRLDTLNSELWRNFRWLLGIQLGSAAGVLLVMAHGFHWF